MNLKKIETYFQITNVATISRRYFIIGFFDGLITVAGMIIGAFISGHNDSELIIPVGFATALALGISSSWGAFEAERIEQKALKKRRERVIISRLEGTVLDEAHKFATLFSSFVHGIAPILSAIILILPYLFFSPFEAFEASMILCSSLIFLLGMVMGKMADENVFINGIRMLILGILVLLAVLILNPGHVI
ncbi:MAG: VIT1/CCC1 transporter family protein [Archaeoglobaceae archaeon]